MRVVTVVTNPSDERFRNYLQASCRHHGLELMALRSNRPMVPSKGGDLREKDRCLQIYLDSVPDDELILFSDGYDAIVTASAERIVGLYRGMGTDVVVSGERVCWPPQPELEDRIPPARTAYRFPNSGGFIGTAGALRTLLERIVTRPPLPRAPWSNQARWVAAYADDPSCLRVDDRCELFCTLTGKGRDAKRWASMEEARKDSAFYEVEAERVARELVPDGGRLRLVSTDTFPCHVHFNGHTKRIAARTSGPLRVAMPWL